MYISKTELDKLVLRAWNTDFFWCTVQYNYIYSKEGEGALELVELIF